VGVSARRAWQAAQIPALAVVVGLAAIVTLAVASAQPPARAAQLTTHAPYRVGIRAIRIVEHRTMRLDGGRVVPRTLSVYVRYPEGGPGHYPLLVFAHGYNITPHPYAPMLQALARAGFVVAAPVFPRTNAHAPGGPDENDLLNQPGDMTAVITRMILDSRRRGDAFTGLVNGQEVAVAGQSDGGITALLTAYNRRYRDRRVKAAVIMSGAEPSIGGYDFAPGSPPMLAIQGTADTTNLPRNTYKFFAQASRPKFLLKLLGAQHLPPYTTEQPQLGIVERTTTAFLNRYLRHMRGSLRQLEKAGRVRGLTALASDP
jgi:pimeloyl-ACP methyl ester carboxylesterase